MRRLVWIGVVTALVAVAAVPLAIAQSPLTGYGGSEGEVQGDVAGTAGGTLPFTGADLTLAALAAVMLIVTGVGITRWSARRS